MNFIHNCILLPVANWLPNTLLFRGFTCVPAVQHVFLIRGGPGVCLGTCSQAIVTFVLWTRLGFTPSS